MLTVFFLIAVGYIENHVIVSNCFTNDRKVFHKSTTVRYYRYFFYLGNFLCCGTYSRIVTYFFRLSLKIITLRTLHFKLLSNSNVFYSIWIKVANV